MHFSKKTAAAALVGVAAAAPAPSGAPAAYGSSSAAPPAYGGSSSSYADPHSGSSTYAPSYSSYPSASSSYAPSYSVSASYSASYSYSSSAGPHSSSYYPSSSSSYVHPVSSSAVPSYTPEHPGTDGSYPGKGSCYSGKPSYPGKPETCPGEIDGFCLSDSDAQTVADIFQELIQNYSDELALAALTEDFTDWSSAVGIIIEQVGEGDVNLLEPLFVGRDAFMAAQGSQPEIPFTQTHVFHGCNSVSMRWYTTRSAAGQPSEVSRIVSFIPNISIQVSC